MNIVWKRPDGGISVTYLTDKNESPEDHAALLKKRGDVPNSWELIGCNMILPASREYRDQWAIDSLTQTVEIKDIVNGLV